MTSREQAVTRKEVSGERKDQLSQPEAQHEHRESDEPSDEQSSSVDDAMVVAINASVNAAPPPTVPAHDTAELGTQPVQDATNTVAAVDDPAPAITAFSAPAMNVSMPAGEQAKTAAVSDTTSVPSTEVQDSGALPKTGNAPSEPQAAAAVQGAPIAAHTQAINIEAPVVPEKAEPDTAKQAVAAVALMKQDGQVQLQLSPNHADGSSLVDAMTQGSAMSGSQGSAGTEQHLAQDSGSFSDSSDESHRPSANVLPTSEGNNRALFLDRMNGMGQPTGVANGGVSRRRQRTIDRRRARLGCRPPGEFRGVAPFSQTVTLDLDPLDMGPLRVRVMMNDQTVHAHIRTEHGELGQGLLQQGQSLESSLRTTGLEMGMLRVTVDQQQGRGDNAWMFQQQQQQQGRSSSSNVSHASSRDDERGVRESVVSDRMTG
ncbi:MAG: flagellar hook-length control protein FliK [Nitrospira sp.]|nr:flagellar hook-length control protein FliK [Nitrospira sp.]